MFDKRNIYFLSILALSSTLSHSATIQSGDILISEVMANPFAVSDSNGEWFELFNASANNIDLNGFIISDNGNNSHEINNNGSLIISAGEYLVLGRNNNTNENGGYTADYVYTGFSLGNSSDQIILTDNQSEIARLNYSGLPFGSAGISAELIRQVINPSESHYQLTQNSIYGMGDTGTPGTQGSFMLTSAAPVPIPAAFWLFASTILVLGRKAKTRIHNQSNQLFPC